MAEPVSGALAGAYQRAEYRVSAPQGEFVMRIGQASAGLAALLRHGASQEAALITAWNPRSEPQPDTVNRAADAALEAALRGMGLHLFRSLASAPDGEHAEPGFLAPGLDRETACALGRRFGQNAIVCAGADAVPELVMLR